jgi:hypothetical protein
MPVLRNSDGAAHRDPALPRRSAAAAAVRSPRPGPSPPGPIPGGRPPVRSPGPALTLSSQWCRSRCPTCPSVPALQLAFLRRPTRPASAPFQAGTSVPIRPGYAGAADGGPASGSRFPSAFRPPAFASRVILRPLGSCAFLTSGLLAVPAGPIGVVTFRLAEMRPGWVPPEPRGRWCAPDRSLDPGRHLPPSSGGPYSPARAFRLREST